MASETDVTEAAPPVDDEPAYAIASPSTRRLAATLGIELGVVAVCTGRISLAREDVLAANAGHPAPPGNAPSAPSPWNVDHQAWGPVREEKLPRFALISAANLAVAHTMTPSVTRHDSADLRRVEAIRADCKARVVRLTALAFHVAALARALCDFPRFNASRSSDGETQIVKD